MEVLDVLKELGFELDEEQVEKVQKAIGKEFVSRTDFNNKNSELKKANTRISDLEKRDFASIEADRDDFKSKYEGLLKEKSDSAKKKKLFEKLDGAKDPDYLLYKYGGLDKLEEDDKGEIKDLENIVKQMKEENPDQFGNTPYIVSKTGGPSENVSNDNEKANAALRSLV